MLTSKNSFFFRPNLQLQIARRFMLSKLASTTAFPSLHRVALIRSPAIAQKALCSFGRSFSTLPNSSIQAQTSTLCSTHIPRDTLTEVTRVFEAQPKTQNPSSIFKATAKLFSQPKGGFSSTQPLRSKSGLDGASSSLFTFRVFWNWFRSKPLAFRLAFVGALALVLSVASSLIYLLLDFVKWVVIIGGAIWLFLRGRRLVLRNGQGVASLLRTLGLTESATKLERSAHTFAAHEHVKEAERQAAAAGRAHIFTHMSRQQGRPEISNFEMKVLQTGGLPLMAMLAQKAIDQLQTASDMQRLVFEKYSERLENADLLKKHFGNSYKLASSMDARIEMHLVKLHGLVDPEFQGDPQADVKVIIPVLASDGNADGCITIFLGQYEDAVEGEEYPLYERKVYLQQFARDGVKHDMQDADEGDVIDEIAVFPDNSEQSTNVPPAGGTVIDADFTEVKK